MGIQVGSLHGIRQLGVDVDVVSPVPTLRGPKVLEHDEEVEIVITAGRVRIEAIVTAGEYKQLLDQRLAQNRPARNPIEQQLMPDPDAEVDD